MEKNGEFKNRKAKKVDSRMWRLLKTSSPLSSRKETSIRTMAREKRLRMRSYKIATTRESAHAWTPLFVYKTTINSLRPYITIGTYYGHVTHSHNKQLR